ncbi:PaaI family thioesterase [Haloglomus litoreum]|uniref:PaaI family thioesterase n=1 Tax=Haloglomus litoreum TaxID=3034026 RepID=UPI0023E8EEFE|nr:PaaI family thioesterase [Haloglomus sp. DT116]
MEDSTKEFINSTPLVSLLGIEITAIGDGEAAGRLDLRRELSGHSDRTIAHGGVTFALADTVGGAAMMSLIESPPPTIDMRVDYLDAGTGVLFAEAEVERVSRSAGTVHVEVFDDEETKIAVVRGVYDAHGW